MRKGYLVLALIGVSLLLLASGCGSSADSQERSMTKEEFVFLAEEFCEDEYEPEEREMKKFAEEHGLLYGGGEPWEQEVLNEAVLYDYVRDKIAFFKSLPVPEGDEEEVGAMIQAFEEGLRKTEEHPAGMAEPRPGANPPSGFWDASYRTTTDYGSWLCGQP